VPISVRTQITAILGLASFASGAAALAFETLWFHQAGLALGNGVWASSLVLAGFMSGMALGNVLAGRIGGATPASLRLYAGVELAVAIAGVALVHFLPATSTTLAPLLVGMADQPGLQQLARFGLAFLLLLIPSTAIGMTLPLVVPVARRAGGDFGWALGFLYGANTAGAVAGVLAVEAVLLPSVGIRTAAWLAAALNGLAATLAWTLAGPVRRLAPSADDPHPPATPGPGHEHAHEHAHGTPARWMAAAFCSGFLMLALEVVWLRFEMLFLNDTSLAFALILATVLCGIAAGGFAAAVWSKRSARALSFAALVTYAASALGLLAFALYPFVLRQYQQDQNVGMVLLFTAPLVLPVSFASGVLFSLLGVALSRAGRSDARATAGLAFANTLGASLGSIVAGFVLLPHAGITGSLLGLLGAYAVLGLLLPVRGQLHPLLRYGGFALCAVSLLAFPQTKLQDFFIRASASRWMTPHDQVGEVREGLNATLFHIVHRLRGLRLFDQLATNAYSMTTNSYAGRRYMKLFVVLPEALHPGLRNTLLIGYGIGNTAEALTQVPELQRIDLVDISTDVLAISRSMRTSSGIVPLDDPRMVVHIEDGRQFLAGTSQRYDLITGEPPPPVLAGVVNLYTREYFALLRSRLAEGGFATYWLPMMNMSADSAKAVIRAFCDAFADCSLWHGESRSFMLMGSRNATAPVSAEHFVRRFRERAQQPELAAIGLEQPAQLGALFIGDAEYLGQLTRDTEPLTDDWPHRMHQPTSVEERDALVAEWRDTRAARGRFATSPLVERQWPAELRDQAMRHFETQRLIDDLLYPNATAPKRIQVLHQVLQATELRLPALLLLGSDPDIQRALRQASPSERERPEWLRQRVAERLAERDFEGALPLLEQLPDRQLALPELRQYVATIVQRARGQPNPAP
jgi:spermidine synthase